MNFDFPRWAVVGYNDDTGLGRMAADARSVLGVRQLVIPSERLTTKPFDPARDSLLRGDATKVEIEQLLAPLQGLLLLERADWHPELLPTARRLGIRTVCVPMWEWFRGTDAVWQQVDFFACPTKMSLQVIQSYGFTNSKVVPWALDLTRFQARQVRGPARTFIHNAGLVDDDDRKGTRETVRAFLRVRRKDVRLIVRAQKSVDLPAVDDRVEVRVGNVEDVASLYAEGEVAVQPSKMEGLGFMVLEPVCCGMPVITTDYPPMNEFVRHRELRVRKRWFARSAFPKRAAAIRHAHLRLPSLQGITNAINWCAANDLSRISHENRGWAESEFNREHLSRVWREALFD